MFQCVQSLTKHSVEAGFFFIIYSLKSVLRSYGHWIWNLTPQTGFDFKNQKRFTNVILKNMEQLVHILFLLGQIMSNNFTNERIPFIVFNYKTMKVLFF